VSDAIALTSTVATIVEQALDAAPSVPGICVAIDHPERGLIAVARGTADPTTGEPLTSDHAARIASCTKTFVASTVLQLAGQGRLSLEQRAIELAPADIVPLVAEFEHGASITVRQLLRHRSGLVDHTLFPEFVAPTDRQWTAAEQLAIAVGKPALFAPDTAFSYSDSGYVLLGQIIEQVTGQSLAAAVRGELRIDLEEYPSIHWEIAEPTPPGLRRAHQLHEGVDSHDWNPSLDLFGGGGIVATMPDLARWWTALFAGRAHAHLAEQLADPRPTTGPDGQDWPSHDESGLGLFRRTIDGVDVWAHGGYWGLQTLHVPAIHTSAALVITHRSPDVPGPGVLADQLVRVLLTD
jgi:D-alanyl-D-alanine carboxypeptidase